MPEMKTIISLWALRYGAADTLREVMLGLSEASLAHSSWTEAGKRLMSEAAVEAAVALRAIERKEYELNHAPKGTNVSEAVEARRSEYDTNTNDQAKR